MLLRTYVLDFPLRLLTVNSLASSLFVHHAAPFTLRAALGARPPPSYCCTCLCCTHSCLDTKDRCLANLTPVEFTSAAILLVTSVSLE